MSPSLVASDRSLLRRLPKAELHCHLDGSVRPQTMLELAKEYKVAMPRDDVDALREYMRVDDAQLKASSPRLACRHPPGPPSRYRAGHAPVLVP